MNKQRLISYICLLGYLWAWAGSAQAMPLLLSLIGSSHETFLTYHEDKIQIVLHHPGHVDEHEPVPKGPLVYQQDVLDKALTMLFDQNQPSDHRIQLPVQKIQAAVTPLQSEIKKIKALKSSAFWTTFFVLPTLDELTCLSLLAQPPPRIDPALRHHRTIVLLN